MIRSFTGPCQWLDRIIFLFESEQRGSKTCLDILNFHETCLGPEIDDDVLLFTRTNNVGYPAFSVWNPCTADRIILYRPTILSSAGCSVCTDNLLPANGLCSTGRAHRTGDLLPANGLSCACCLPTLVLRSSFSALASAWRVPFGAMPTHLLVAHCSNSIPIQRTASNQYTRYSDSL